MYTDYSDLWLVDELYVRRACLLPSSLVEIEVLDHCQGNFIIRLLHQVGYTNQFTVVSGGGKVMCQGGCGRCLACAGVPLPDGEAEVLLSVDVISLPDTTFIDPTADVGFELGLTLTLTDSDEDNYYVDCTYDYVVEYLNRYRDLILRKCAEW